jgi:hypothetical protein
MYLIREIYHCKPEMTEEFSNKLYAAISFMEADGFLNIKVLTGVASNLFDVVLVYEIDRLSNLGLSTKLKETKILKGFLELVVEARREIFQVVTQS